MGSDRHMESRYIAESNFWPARALLVRAAAAMRVLRMGSDPAIYAGLERDIKDFLERTGDA